MKIADLTVGTEYAATSYYRRGATDWSLLERSRRVLLTAIGRNGNITVSDWDPAKQRFTEGSYGTQAKTLVMPWVEAVPELEEMKQSRIRQAILGREAVAREQEALRYIGSVLDGTDIKGLPYDLEPAIALARGDEGERPIGRTNLTTRNRHTNKVTLPVVTLAEILEAAVAKALLNA